MSLSLRPTFPHFPVQPRQSQRHVAHIVSQCFQDFLRWNNNFKELWPAVERGGGGRKERLTRKEDEMET